MFWWLLSWAPDLWAENEDCILEWLLQASVHLLLCEQPKGWLLAYHQHVQSVTFIAWTIVQGWQAAIASSRTVITSIMQHWQQEQTGCNSIKDKTSTTQNLATGMACNCTMTVMVPLVLMLV